VRFTDRTSRRSRLKLMTDGILLAELQRDRQLRRYDTIIIDEAHERSLNIDFLLGYLKAAAAAAARPQVDHHQRDHRRRPVRRALRRPGGRGVRTDVPGRAALPALVELPEEDEDGEPIVRDQTEAILDAVRELTAEGPGDILVFLRVSGRSGTPRTRWPRWPTRVPRSYRSTHASRGRAAQGVRTAHRAPRRTRHQRRRDLPDRARDQVRRRHRRRADLAYSVRTKVQRLPVEAISQASANQRSGRCGRLGPGIAIRLYSEEDFEGPAGVNTGPEILRPTWPASSCR
jgi:ATP-dependent helicase HrpA